MIEAQLFRSANAPLRVYWSPCQDGGLPDLHSAELVLAHSSRWRVLVLNISEYESVGWLHAANGRLPALEKFESRGQYAEIPNIFSTAPSLRKVFLADWNFEPSLQALQALQLSWAQITHYSGSLRLEWQMEILEKTPNLVSCAIGFPVWIHNFEPGISLVLPRLRRLHIEMPGFLQRLQAPLLRELFCSYSGGHGRSEIVPFVEKSGCSLQKLSLMHCSINSDLITVLRDLPSVIHLIIEVQNEIENFSEQGDLFDALADDLCPNLTSLAYGFESNFTAAHFNFFNMAQSRFRLNLPRSCLTQLRLFRSRDYRASEAYPPSIMAAIQDMCNVGFDARCLEPSEVDDLLQGKHFFS
jgi:hypothetical protein